MLFGGAPSAAVCTSYRARPSCSPSPSGRLLPPSRVAGAGQHILETSPDQMTMSGYRVSDNDECSAARVQ